MTFSNIKLAAALISVSLLGAGCVTVGGNQAAAPAAKTTPTVIKQAAPDNSAALSAACGESGGTFIAASSGCMCPTNYIFETKTNECIDTDGTPGGTRGETIRVNFKKNLDCIESGGTYDVTKGWCSCPDGLTFSQEEAECLGIDGIPGGVRGDGVRRGVSKVTTSQTTPASTATTAPEQNEEVPTDSSAAQKKCEADAAKYLVEFKAAHEKPVADLYAGYVQTANFSQKYNGCFTHITYQPKGGALANSKNQMVESSYESVGDVAARTETAYCIYYTNMSNGSKFEECFIGEKKFTKSIFSDYVRQVMVNKR